MKYRNFDIYWREWGQYDNPVVEHPKLLIDFKSVAKSAFEYVLAENRKLQEKIHDLELRDET